MIAQINLIVFSLEFKNRYYFEKNISYLLVSFSKTY
jgi:hypothetical protein